MYRKIGFWSVFALVTGSQIGSGVFMAPTALAPYGVFGLMGWIISGIGTIALSMVFATLCSQYPHTGGPHVYINKAFGKSAAFFTGWTYWVISWVSTPVVIITSIGYLSPFIGNQPQLVYLSLELLLLICVTLLNLRGVYSAGKVEIVLTLLKFIPLMIIPICALYFFDANNITIDQHVVGNDIPKALGRTALLTLWGFIGLETATAAAGAVKNPDSTIPKATIIGTLSVVILYFINSIGIMGLISGSELASSNAPYVDAAKTMFGGHWYLVISVIASIVCIGTLNAWTLTSGQIALGLAQDSLMPKVFIYKNSHDAPIYGLLISSIGIASLLILTSDENLSKQIEEIIGFSATAFLFVYLICSIALLKLLIMKKELSITKSSFIITSILFSGWVIYQADIKVLLIAGLFVVSGLPMYMFWLRKSSNIKAINV